MFANAVKNAMVYTRPVIVSSRHFDGRIVSGCAAFIVLNDEGWILTAAHIIETGRLAVLHASEIRAFEAEKAKIAQNSNLTPKQQHRAINKLRPNKDWIINNSYWWDGAEIKEFKFNEMLDIAIGKLDSFDKEKYPIYPIFKDPKSEFPIGTSLCKLGFPLHDIKVTFDDVTGSFNLEPGALPVPFFPIDGIHTRVLVVKDVNLGKEAKFIESSSPGLRGQSGGPTFDVDGVIWGLQSHTRHLELGFNPKVKYNKKEIEEHQFINTGYGTHVEEIVNFLTENDIEFNLSES